MQLFRVTQNWKITLIGVAIILLGSCQLVLSKKIAPYTLYIETTQPTTGISVFLPEYALQSFNLKPDQTRELPYTAVTNIILGIPKNIQITQVTILHQHQRIAIPGQTLQKLSEKEIQKHMQMTDGGWLSHFNPKFIYYRLPTSVFLQQMKLIYIVFFLKLLFLYLGIIIFFKKPEHALWGIIVLLSAAYYSYRVFPSFFDFDNYYVYRAIFEHSCNNWHPPLWQYLWSKIYHILPSVHGLLTIQIVAFFSGIMVISCITQQFRILPTLLLYSTLAFSPLCLYSSLVLDKDYLQLAFMLISLGLLMLYEYLNTNTNKKNWLLLVIIYISIQMTFMFRHDSYLIILPLCYCLAKIIRSHIADIYKKTIPLLLIIGILFSSLIINNKIFENKLHCYNIVSKAQFILPEIMAISLVGKKDYIPDYAFWPENKHKTRLLSVLKEIQEINQDVLFRNPDRTIQNLRYVGMTKTEEADLIKLWLRLFPGHYKTVFQYHCIGFQRLLTAETPPIQGNPYSRFMMSFSFTSWQTNAIPRLIKTIFPYTFIMLPLLVIIILPYLTLTSPVGHTKFTLKYLWIFMSICLMQLSTRFFIFTSTGYRYIALCTVLIWISFIISSLLIGISIINKTQEYLRKS